MKKNRLFITLILLFFCFVPFAGCGIFAWIGEIFGGDDSVDPKIPVEEKVIAVLPFEDDLFPYFEADRGKRLALSVVANVQDNMDYTSLKRIFRAEGEELERYFHFYKDTSWKDTSWTKVADMVKADWVVYGKIESFRTQNPDDVGVHQGEAEVSFKVYDAKKGKVILQKTHKVRYPKKAESSVFPTGMSQAEITLKIEGGLLEEMARLVGREFYTYTKDPRYTVQ